MENTKKKKVLKIKQKGTTYVLLEFQKEQKKNEAEAIFEEIRGQHFLKVINYSYAQI